MDCSQDVCELKPVAPTDIHMSALQDICVPFGATFEVVRDIPARTGHLAVAGITQSGCVHLHRPSSQHLTEDRNLHLDIGAFWEHSSGRTIHISGQSPIPAGQGDGALCTR